MAPSKLSPAERAYRKREAARLRQQRCRERKRQANLKKKLQEQEEKKEAEKSKEIVTSGQNRSTDTPRVKQEFQKIDELPPLVEKVTLPRSYLGQSQIINACGSFPSLSSEPTPSSDRLPEETCQTSSTASAKATFAMPLTEKYCSPRSVIGNLTPSSQTLYEQKSFQVLPQAVSPSMLTISELDEKIYHSQNLHQQRPSLPQQSHQPNHLELDVVHAMLSLKSDAPNRNTIRNNLLPQRRSHMNSHQGTGRTMLHPLSHQKYFGREDHNIQQVERIIRAESLMRRRDNLNPGFHVYYNEG